MKTDYRKPCEEIPGECVAIFRTYINASPIGIFVISNSGRYVDLNPAGVALLGYSREEIQEIDMPQIVADESMEAAEKHFASVQAEGLADGEFILKRKDGSRFWARVTASRLTETQFIAFKQDISRQKGYEQELARAKEQSDAANQAKSLFLAKMSHEIRTPITAVVGMTELLRFSQLTDEQREYVDNIDVSTDNLLAIISDILDLSKIEAGKVELDVSEFSLTGCLNELINLKMNKIRKKGLDISFNLSAGLPGRVCGDQLKFKQILLNLIGNAIKFTEKGMISIEVSVRHPDNGVALTCVTVGDTGIGISPETLPQLFKPFSRADHSGNSETSGTGLGLAICWQLAELMGGKIRAESEIGRGSWFHLEIPFTLPLQSHENIKTTDISKSVLDAERALTILVAEDNRENMEALTLLLEKLGQRVVRAENGKIAVELWKNGGIDLILMDIQMPEMNGIEAFHAIRAEEGERRTPVIAVTANALKSSREMLFLEGFDGYIVKPYRVEQIISVFKNIVSTHSDLSEASHTPC